MIPDCMHLKRVRWQLSSWQLYSEPMEETILKMVKRMWRARLPLWRYFNRGSEMFQYINSLKSRDPDFNRAFAECNAKVAAASVGFSSFMGLAMQAKLLSLCTLKDDISLLLKYTQEANPNRASVTSALALVSCYLHELICLSCGSRSGT